jgi:hypothetical protein
MLALRLPEILHGHSAGLPRSRLEALDPYQPQKQHQYLPSPNPDLVSANRFYVELLLNS